MLFRVDPALKIPRTSPTRKVNEGNVPILFLVLEVSEKREYVDLAGARCPAKKMKSGSNF